MGTLALAARSSDDAAAWCLLALVLSYIEGSSLIAILAIGGGALYVAVMLLLLGRPLLRVLDRGVDGRGRIAPGTLVACLLVLMLGEFVTDAVGIYAVLGAFIAGIAMPRGRFADAAIVHLEPLTTTFLLPVFFVYSGLNSQIASSTRPRSGASRSSWSRSRSWARAWRACSPRGSRESPGASRSPSAS